MPAYWHIWKFIFIKSNAVKYYIIETFSYFLINKPLQNGQKLYKLVFLVVYVHSYLSETSQGRCLAEFRIFRFIKLMSTYSPKSKLTFSNMLTYFQQNIYIITLKYIKIMSKLMLIHTRFPLMDHMTMFVPRTFGI